MMGIPRFLGLFTIIPATVLLTISFFVLVVVRTVKEQALKSFGRIIAVLLWLVAALVFSTGLYVTYTFTFHPRPMMPCMKR